MGLEAEPVGELTLHSAGNDSPTDPRPRLVGAVEYVSRHTFGGLTAPIMPTGLLGEEAVIVL